MCLYCQGLESFSYPLLELQDLRPLFVPKGLPVLSSYKAFQQECLFFTNKISFDWNMYSIDKCYINVYKRYACGIKCEQKQVAVRCCGRKDKQMVTETTLPEFVVAAESRWQEVVVFLIWFSLGYVAQWELFNLQVL